MTSTEHTMAEQILWFDALSRASTSVAGGKGANLGEMTRAKLPVPPGCVVPAAAFLGALDDAGIRARLAELFASVDPDHPAAFFEDLWDRVLHDDVLARLLTFSNVLVTARQGFLTHEALANIAATTLENMRAFERGAPLVNEVRAAEVLRPRSPS